MPGIGRPDNADPEALVFQRICDDTAYLVELEKGIRSERLVARVVAVSCPADGLLEGCSFMACSAAAALQRRALGGVIELPVQW